jgi:hypothetical protein
MNNRLCIHQSTRLFEQQSCAVQERHTVVCTSIACDLGKVQVFLYNFCVRMNQSPPLFFHQSYVLFGRHSRIIYY